MAWSHMVIIIVVFLVATCKARPSLQDHSQSILNVLDDLDLIDADNTQRSKTNQQKRDISDELSLEKELETIATSSSHLLTKRSSERHDRMKHHGQNKNGVKKTNNPAIRHHNKPKKRSGSTPKRSDSAPKSRDTPIKNGYTKKQSRTGLKRSGNMSKSKHAKSSPTTLKRSKTKHSKAHKKNELSVIDTYDGRHLQESVKNAEQREIKDRQKTPKTTESREGIDIPTVLKQGPSNDPKDHEPEDTGDIALYKGNATDEVFSNENKTVHKSHGKNETCKGAACALQNDTGAQKEANETKLDIQQIIDGSNNATKLMESQVSEMTTNEFVDTNASGITPNDTANETSTGNETMSNSTATSDGENKILQHDEVSSPPSNNSRDNAGQNGNLANDQVTKNHKSPQSNKEVDPARLKEKTSNDIYNGKAENKVGETENMQKTDKTESEGSIFSGHAGTAGNQQTSTDSLSVSDGSPMLKKNANKTEGKKENANIEETINANVTDTSIDEGNKTNSKERKCDGFDCLEQEMKNEEQRKGNKKGNVNITEKNEKSKNAKTEESLVESLSDSPYQPQDDSTESYSAGKCTDAACQQSAKNEALLKSKAIEKETNKNTSKAASNSGSGDDGLDHLIDEGKSKFGSDQKTGDSASVDSEEEEIFTGSEKTQSSAVGPQQTGNVTKLSRDSEDDDDDELTVTEEVTPTSSDTVDAAGEFAASKSSETPTSDSASEEFSDEKSNKTESDNECTDAACTAMKKPLLSEGERDGGNSTAGTNQSQLDGTIESHSNVTTENGTKLKEDEALAARSNHECTDASCMVEKGENKNKEDKENPEKITDHSGKNDSELTSESNTTDNSASDGRSDMHSSRSDQECTDPACRRRLDEKKQEESDKEELENIAKTKAANAEKGADSLEEKAASESESSLLQLNSSKPEHDKSPDNGIIPMNHEDSKTAEDLDDITHSSRSDQECTDATCMAGKEEPSKQKKEEGTEDMQLMEENKEMQNKTGSSSTQAGNKTNDQFRKTEEDFKPVGGFNDIDDDAEQAQSVHSDHTGQTNDTKEEILPQADKYGRKRNETIVASDKPVYDDLDTAIAEFNKAIRDENRPQFSAKLSRKPSAHPGTEDKFSDSDWCSDVTCRTGADVAKDDRSKITKKHESGKEKSLPIQKSKINTLASQVTFSNGYSPERELVPSETFERPEKVLSGPVIERAVKKSKRLQNGGSISNNRSSRS